MLNIKHPNLATTPEARMNRRTILGSVILLIVVVGVLGGLGLWKYRQFTKAREAAEATPWDPSESVASATARLIPFRMSQSVVGTVSAVRSITLKNELVGVVKEVPVQSGQVVQEGDVLVVLDASVDQAQIAAAEASVRAAEANIRAAEAELELAKTNARRLEGAVASNAAPQADLDRARAEVDRAKSGLERDRAIVQQLRAAVMPLQTMMQKKTIKAPFAARVGLVDTHPGQYLAEGTEITTLQEIAKRVYIDFMAPQTLAMTLTPGSTITLTDDDGTALGTASVQAADARVNRVTRSTMLRAVADGAVAGLSPGASVRVALPVGPERQVVVVPVTALGRGPEGDHVFVLQPDEKGKTRAKLRPVVGGASIGNEVIIRQGLEPGEIVAASGSFKLHDGVGVDIAPAAGSPPQATTTGK
ncbi:MAG: efflux RND transporter periplasmic adaptor subunit [bacterium]